MSINSFNIQTLLENLSGSFQQNSNHEQINPSQQNNQDKSHSLQWILLSNNLEENCKASVSQSKPFLWNEKRKQWLWYKNLVIPTIEVKEISQLTSGQNKNLNKLKIKVSCWKLLDNKQFEEIGLQGETSLPFNKKKILLSGLKFGETTFVSKSSNFRLVITLEQQQGEQLESQTLAVFVSPSVYVEARRKAQKKSKKRLNVGFDSLFTPFSSAQSRNLNSNHHQKSLDSISSISKKDLESLHSYLLEKVNQNEAIHPVILKLKFTNILRLFTDKSINPVPTSLVIQFFQLSLQLMINQITNEGYEALLDIQSVVSNIIPENKERSDKYSVQKSRIVFCLNFKNSSAYKKHHEQADKITSLIEEQGFSVLKLKEEKIEDDLLEISLPPFIRDFFLDKFLLSNSSCSMESFFNINFQTLCLQSCSGQKKNALVQDMIIRDRNNNSKKVNSKSYQVSKQGETWINHLSTIDLKDFYPEPSVMKKIKVERDLNNKISISSPQIRESKQIESPLNDNTIESFNDKCSIQEDLFSEIKKVEVKSKSPESKNVNSSSFKLTSKKQQEYSQERGREISLSSFLPSESFLKSTQQIRLNSNFESTTTEIEEEINQGQNIPLFQFSPPSLQDMNTYGISPFSSGFNSVTGVNISQNQIQALTLLLEANKFNYFRNNSSMANSQPVIQFPLLQNYALAFQGINSFSSSLQQLPL